MRVVAGMLAVFLAHPVAFAEDPGGAAGAADRAAEAPVRQKVPIRVVRIMPETNQALVYDRSGGGTHLLVTVGEKIGGYTVEAIDEDEVTLSESGRQIVLAAPERSWRRRSPEARRPVEPARAPRAEEPAPADPYAGAALSVSSPIAAPGPAPADPYAQEIREVRAPSAAAPAAPVPSAPAAPAAPAVPAPSAGSALALVDPYPAPRAAAPGPADPYAEEIREVKAPSSPAPPAASPASPASPAPPAASPAPAVASAPAGAAAPMLTRAEVDAALANFSALTVAFRASFTPAGVKVESVLDGSVFAKAGLRAGDVIASVEGRPLRSLDDVAALYARAGSLRAVTAQVVRGGKPLTLRVSIQ